MSVGRPSYLEQVRSYWARHHNEWHTIAQIAAELGISKGSARSACRALHRKRELICSDDQLWAQRQVTKATVPEGQRNVALTFRTRAGYMSSSRFAPGDWVVEVIWAGDEPLIGPFCKHCGNPQHVHGPERECLNYRISPLLPVGDLPRTTTT